LEFVVIYIGNVSSCVWLENRGSISDHFKWQVPHTLPKQSARKWILKHDIYIKHLFTLSNILPARLEIESFNAEGKTITANGSSHGRKQIIMFLYPVWKLIVLMLRAKTSANKIENDAVATATGPIKSCL